mmetsp:Transcript_44795/g.84215  ORF Transcript_44795/g.84215 Transcript_44795/m.84215 type:complete len:426 (-) Transcript_44795:80-1357(-)
MLPASSAPEQPEERAGTSVSGETLSHSSNPGLLEEIAKGPADRTETLGVAPGPRPNPRRGEFYQRLLSKERIGQGLMADMKELKEACRLERKEHAKSRVELAQLRKRKERLEDDIAQLEVKKEWQDFHASCAALEKRGSAKSAATKACRGPASSTDAKSAVTINLDAPPSKEPPSKEPPSKEPPSNVALPPSKDKGVKRVDAKGGNPADAAGTGPASAAATAKAGYPTGGVQPSVAPALAATPKAASADGGVSEAKDNTGSVLTPNPKARTKPAWNDDLPHPLLCHPLLCKAHPQHASNQQQEPSSLRDRIEQRMKAKKHTMELQKDTASSASKACPSTGTSSGLSPEKPLNAKRVVMELSQPGALKRTRRQSEVSGATLSVEIMEAPESIPSASAGAEAPRNGDLQVEEPAAKKPKMSAGKRVN